MNRLLQPLAANLHLTSWFLTLGARKRPNATTPTRRPNLSATRIFSWTWIESLPSKSREWHETLAEAITLLFRFAR